MVDPWNCGSKDLRAGKRISNEQQPTFELGRKSREQEAAGRTVGKSDRRLGLKELDSVRMERTS